MLDELIGCVDVERLYRHVLQLEGERHPLTAPQGLAAAADYIEARLRDYGVNVREHVFTVTGYDGAFRNIEGWLGDADAPAAVVMNHYDTFYGTTGANDNAAAVAVMLEAARVIALAGSAPTARFLSFSLEEGNPAFQSRLLQNGRDLGVLDARGRYTSYCISQLMREHLRGMARYRNGMSLAAVFAEVTEEMRGRMPEPLYRHLKEHEAVYQEVTFLPGTFGHIGSWAWMDEAVQLRKPLAFGICLDEIGRVHLEPGTQRLPPGMSWEAFRTYKVDKEHGIGDWVWIITDGQTGPVGQAFCAHCERPDIDLHYGYWHLPLSYEEVVAQYPQALGSDYSAFWRAGVPAMFLFDTAGFRPPYVGHTMADTIDRLDFDQIARICRATVATLIDPALRG
jgi:hypothetical protein